ncbi:hypothetical protein BKA83DRAFT_1146258 [Pisolithus microcarpus]|nr:hypothetical protein BKA83DRAFT_1146258 [Pisolithus microcarpus]
MPQQVEHATVMMLDSITEDDVGRKLRVADSHAFRFRLFKRAFQESQRRPQPVWVVGYLERADDQLPIPILPSYLRAPNINRSIFMRALIISPAKDLDIVRLHAALTAMAEVPPTPYPV